jgi:hypothetical protein
MLTSDQVCLPCPYCSNSGQQVYHGGKCPLVKAVEYYPDGAVKRVEFYDEPATVVEAGQR